MKNTVTRQLNERVLVEQEKKLIMLSIKELQRDLIKASFKQSSGSGEYAELLQQINDERDKLKQLNQRLAQR